MSAEGHEEPRRLRCRDGRRPSRTERNRCIAEDVGIESGGRETEVLCCLEMRGVRLTW